MAARTAVNPPATEVVPVTLVVGEEEFLRRPRRPRPDRRARDAAPGGDVHDLDASALSPGELDSLTSPSLFGGGCVLAVRSAQNAGKEVAAELARYARNPAPDVVLVLTHAGGAKGKELAGRSQGSRARMMEYPKLSRFSERWTSSGRSSAARAGAPMTARHGRCSTRWVSDLRELAAACDQLARRHRRPHR